MNPTILITTEEVKYGDLAEREKQIFKKGMEHGAEAQKEFGSLFLAGITLFIGFMLGILQSMFWGI